MHATAAAAPPITPQASTLARAAWLAYFFLIVYASWYPFSGWHDLGIGPLAYLNWTVPHYWTRFDVATNVVGYIPFGILTVYVLYPAIRGVWAFLMTLLIGALVSGLMEAVQTFLPTRVPSNLDFITNFAGAVIGAGIGMATIDKLLGRDRLRTLRQRWFLLDSSAALVLVTLWPLAQIYPQPYLFGHGQLVPIVSDWMSDLFESPVDIAAWLRQGVQLSVEQYWLSETVITACGLSGALLALLCLLRPLAPRARLVMCLIGAALLVKALATALLFTPDNAFAWLTPGAQGGILLGVLMVSGLAFAPPMAQRRLALATLLISLLVVNIIPANPYFVATLQSWVQGKFLNFNGAAQFLSLLWPFCAVLFLLRSERQPSGG
ncbi:MAG: VanZ family protein [Pseudomonadota bacterium]